MQLIDGISSDLHKLLEYFSGTVINTFSRIPLAWFKASWATAFPTSLALYLKDSKVLVLVISALKLVVSFLE